MSRDLAVLIVEDVESDAELAIRWLKKAGHEVVYARVESASQLKDAVEEQAWDVIIADYSLPQFSAPAALKLLQETGLDIPFIVVSGTIGEEIAVAMMKAGAHDYLLKDNLARLAPAIERELDQAQVRHARKQMEEERDITVQLLRLLSEKNDEHELMRQVTNLLHTWSGCEAIGIRLQNGDDFPYFETSGFPARFVKLESSLCAKDAAGNLLRDRQGNPVLECMCGNVLCSRTDPGKPFFTAHGSFWSNCTTQLLATTTDEDRQAHTRNRCNGAGYESVALIPLRAAGITYGLVQLNDFREGRFTPERIALFERLADTIASGLAERLAQKTLQESEARYRAVALSANDAIITSDVADKIVGWNLSAQRIFGYTEDEILGQPVTMLLTQMYSERHRLGMEKMPITGVENILGKTIEGEGQRKDGFLSLDKTEPGYYTKEHAKRLEVLARHAALALLNALNYGEVEQASITDYLTGAYNHRYFQQQLRVEWERASRTSHPLSLLIVDIDHFKNVNDAYGHLTGDQVLRVITTRMKGELRGSDQLARYGGEEFAVILPNTSTPGAENVGERLRRSISAFPIWVESLSIEITVSVGVATYPDQANTPQDLISRADQAMYQAKAHGRNCIYISGS
jgi:diguanylate cyclase (GGDEF)-like protein/PAS domain S-box-containing protein